MANKNFFKLKTTGGTVAKPNELNQLYYKSVKDYEEAHFFEQFEFKNQEELAKAIKILAYSITGDAYFCEANRKADNMIRAVYNRWNSILLNADKWEKYPIAKAGQMWGNFFGRRKLNDDFAKMFAEAPDAMEFVDAEATIMSVYSLTPDDMKKIHFFVEQVKARDKFPNSLRRMLYIWGTTKLTGKTTTAKMIVCILNGEFDFDSYTKFETTLQTEMQVGDFRVPRISECNCALMDECFYSDMSKTYNDFKRKITTSNGTARLPYGQTFEWFGQPNYIATSNEPLKKFIKDYNDRRYLSIEFKHKPTSDLTFDQVYELWRRYIVNSQRTKGWKEWADEIEDISAEQGEYQELTDEYEAELKTRRFLDMILNILPNGAREANNNRRTLKYFVDYFAINDNTARKHRGEIEKAVINVFGGRLKGKKYWVHEDLYNIARQLVYSPEKTQEEIKAEEDMPF